MVLNNTHGTDTHNYVIEPHGKRSEITSCTARPAESETVCKINCMISVHWELLRRRYAPALLIQKPDFQTIKCPCVCPDFGGDLPNDICAGQIDRYHSGYFSVDFQDAEKNAFSR